ARSLRPARDTRRADREPRLRKRRVDRSLDPRARCRPSGVADRAQPRAGAFRRSDRPDRGRSGHRRVEAGGPPMNTLRELLRIARLPRARVATSVVLGSLSVLLGVGLMSLAGYVISRAAEHPPILSLTVAIVAVRVCGIGKPVARYLERL